jgi:hypothetical protein
MNLLDEAMNGLGAVLLRVVAGLLLEELTFGGLVRLLMAPLPGPRKRRELDNRNNLKGERKCWH